MSVSSGLTIHESRLLTTDAQISFSCAKENDAWYNIACTTFRSSFPWADEESQLELDRKQGLVVFSYPNLYQHVSELIDKYYINFR